MFNGNGKTIVNPNVAHFAELNDLNLNSENNVFLYIHSKFVLFGLFIFYCYTWAWSNSEQMWWSITCGLSIVIECNFVFDTGKELYMDKYLQ